MRHIVEFQYHGRDLPYFIDPKVHEGASVGSFVNGSGKSCYIGITKDDSNIHIPKLESDSGDLKDYTTRQPVKDIAEAMWPDMTSQEVSDLIDDIFVAAGRADIPNT